MKNSLILSAILLAIPTDGHSQQVPPMQTPAFYLLSTQEADGQPGPPLPFNPFPGLPLTQLPDGRGYLVDDLVVAFARSFLMEVSAQESTPPTPGGGGGTNGQDDGPPTYTYGDYGPSDVWLELTAGDQNATHVLPQLHNATNGLWELFTKPNLTPPLGINEWTPLEILEGSPTTNTLHFTPFSTEGIPESHFRAVGGNHVVSVEPDIYWPTATEPCSPLTNGRCSKFTVSASNLAEGADITVSYRLSGSAINGVDFTNLSGSVVVTGDARADVWIHPIYDNIFELQESVTLTVLVTNGYLVNPNRASATVWIQDCIPTNLFGVVATDIPKACGIDYLSTSNSLLISVNCSEDHTWLTNFSLLGTNANGLAAYWSSITNLNDEVKLATVKNSVGGFVLGDTYFSSGSGIGWLSANGASHILNWATLTNSTVANALPIRGGVYLDQTAVFGNDLIAVTSEAVPESGKKGIWRVKSNGEPSLLAMIDTKHLEGVVTLTNDPVRWGPWAGKVLTGDESASFQDRFHRPLIFAVDTNGVANSFALGIAPEDFDIIPPDQDLYCVVDGGLASSVVKISRDVFASHVGDLLITEADESGTPQGSRLFVVHWNGTGFDIRRLEYSPGPGCHFEHSAFAPVSLPTLQP